MVHIKTAIEYIRSYSRLNFGNVFVVINEEDYITEKGTMCDDIQISLKLKEQELFMQCMAWPSTHMLNQLNGIYRNPLSEAYDSCH